MGSVGSVHHGRGLGTGLAVRDVDLEPPAATRASCVTVPLHCESERVQGRAFRALVFSEVAGFVALLAVRLFPPCSVSAGSSGAAFFLAGFSG